MEQKNCKVCGKLMNYIKAGFSQRTQKSYEAFYACPDKCKQPAGTKVSNDSMEIIGEILADLQAKINGMQKQLDAVYNQILPEEK